MDTGITLKIGKVCALIAILAFILLPQASCGQMTIDGLDILTNKYEESSWTFLGWSMVIVCGIALLFATNPSVICLLGIIGLAAILLMLSKIKGTDEFTKQMIEIENGAYLTILGLIGMIIIPWFAKEE